MVEFPVVEPLTAQTRTPGFKDYPLKTVTVLLRLILELFGVPVMVRFVYGHVPIETLMDWHAPGATVTFDGVVVT